MPSTTPPHGSNPAPASVASPPARTRPDHVARVVLVSAWATGILVATQFALVATFAIAALLVALLRQRRWRPVLPFAIALALSQFVAIMLWATRTNPPSSLSKDLDPIHAGVTVALAIATALAAHLTMRRARRTTTVGNA